MTQEREQKRVIRKSDLHSIPWSEMPEPQRGDITLKRGGGRPRAAEPTRNADGTFSVRLTMELEGETVRKTVHLGTKDRAVAKKRAEKLANGESLEAVVKKGRTFREVAERVMAESVIRTKKERESRLLRYAYPILGEMAPEEIGAQDIKACLSLMEETVGWTRSIKLLKSDISSVLGSLYGDGELKENVCLRVNFQKLKPIRRTKPIPIVLTDDEFTRFLAHGCMLANRTINDPNTTCWALPELHMLALCSRCLGGMRTSDLHAWRWEHIDTAQWFEAKVPRPKTMGGAEVFETSDEGEDGAAILEPYQLPEELGRFLYSWWVSQGSPQQGPVFPVRRGPRAGEHKRPRTSYAEALRDALWEAEVVRPLPGFELARPEDRRQHCALQSGIAGRRACVDFHSFRRAFVQGTLGQAAQGKLTLQESMRLADHKDPLVHLKYSPDGARRVIPAAALPALPAGAPGGFGSGAAKTRSGGQEIHQ